MEQPTPSVPDPQIPENPLKKIFDLFKTNTTYRKLAFIGVFLILISAFGFWAQNDYSVDFSKFFASEPCQPRPACLDATPQCYIRVPVGGWCPPKPAEQTDIVACAPTTQTVAVNLPATFGATGGNGSYAWTAPEGTEVTTALSDATYLVKYAQPGIKKVTVQSFRGDNSGNLDSVACTVIVTP